MHLASLIGKITDSNERLYKIMVKFDQIRQNGKFRSLNSITFFVIKKTINLVSPENLRFFTGKPRLRFSILNFLSSNAAYSKTGVCFGFSRQGHSLHRPDFTSLLTQADSFK